MLCWRACAALPCCAPLLLLCWAVSCGAFRGFCLFAGLAAWPAALLCVLWCCVSVWYCAVVPRVFFASLVVFVPPLKSHCKPRKNIFPLFFIKI